MREGWEIKKLGEICDVSAGQGAPQGNDKYSPTGTPFVKAGDLSGLLQGQTEKDILQVSADIIKSHRLKVYPAGALLFAKSGMSCMKGYVYTLKHPCCVVSHLAILTPKGSSSSYLQYCLRHIKPNTLVKDPAYPSISLADISSMCIPVPPVQEQEKIVAELDCLSGIIEKKKQQLKELDNLAQSIFYDMFGDPIANEKGWETKTMKDVCEKLYAGGDVPKERFSKTKTATYSIPILSNGKGDSALYGFTDIPRETSPAITISGRGTIGYSHIQVEPFYPIIRLIVAVPKPIINIIFLQGHISLMTFESTGGAIPQLTIPMVKNRKIIIPPLDLQNAFAQKIEAIDQQKRLIKKSIQETETLFNSRMDYWFN